MQLAGSLIAAGAKRTTQKPGRALALHEQTGKQDGDPDPNLRRWRVSGRMRQTNKKRARLEGRPHARGTIATVEGARVSEGCKVATKSGNE